MYVYLWFWTPCSVLNAVMFVAQVCNYRLIYCLPLFHDQRLLSLLALPPSSSFATGSGQTYYLTQSLLSLPTPLFFIHGISTNCSSGNLFFFTYNSSLALFLKLTLFICFPVTSGTINHLLSVFASSFYFSHLIDTQRFPQGFLFADGDTIIHCACTVWQAVCWVAL